MLHLSFSRILVPTVCRQNMVVGMLLRLSGGLWYCSLCFTKDRGPTGAVGKGGPWEARGMWLWSSCLHLRKLVLTFSSSEEHVLV